MAQMCLNICTLWADIWVTSFYCVWWRRVQLQCQMCGYGCEVFLCPSEAFKFLCKLTWWKGFACLGYEIFSCELCNLCVWISVTVSFNRMLFYLRVQGTNCINWQHKEVWIDHFILNIWFVRRDMYILPMKLQYLSFD